MIVRHSK